MSPAEREISVMLVYGCIHIKLLLRYLVMPVFVDQDCPVSDRKTFVKLRFPVQIAGSWHHCLELKIKKKNKSERRLIFFADVNDSDQFVDTYSDADDS